MTSALRGGTSSGDGGPRRDFPVLTDDATARRSARPNDPRLAPKRTGHGVARRTAGKNLSRRMHFPIALVPGLVKTLPVVRALEPIPSVAAQ